MTSNKKVQKGFTLIETLVAVLILSSAIAGPLSLASRSLNTALVAKDQIIAYYLAQDAVEYIRFKRDTACLAGGSPCGGGVWLATVADCVGGNGCNIDSTADTVVECTTADCANAGRMRFNTGSNTYSTNTSNAVPPVFTRAVLITGSGDEAQIQVTVSWSDVGNATGVGCSSGLRCVIVKENILNWQ